jgi:hypothetical protein
MKLASVPLAVCCWLSAASAQPYPSFLLDTTRVIGSDYDDAWATQVAFGDSLGLVVWTGTYCVKGCLITRDMHVADSVCLDIGGREYYPSVLLERGIDVAWSGQSYLVAWIGKGGVYGSLVSPQGSVLRRLVVQRTGESRVYSTSVASDGDDFLVVWDELAGNRSREMYVRVSGEGALMDTARSVCHASGSTSYGDVAFGDSCYMVAFCYSDEQDGEFGLAASRIRADGSQADTTPFPIRETALSVAPVVGFVGGQFFAAWGEGQDSQDIRFARVTQSGTVIDTGGVLVGRDRRVLYFAAAGRSDTCLLAWISWESDTWRVSARRIDGSARPLDSLNLGISSTYMYSEWGTPSGISVSSPADFVVTWCHTLDTTLGFNNRDAVYRRVSSGGAVLDSTEVVLSFAASSDLRPDVASDGESFMAVWQEVRKSSPLARYLRAARFSSDGTRLDSGSFPVGDSGAFGPAVAYGGGCYMVCWTQPSGCRIEAARVSPDGTVLDTIPIFVAPSLIPVHDVDVAYGDGVFLVVWNRSYFGCWGARLLPNGARLDSTPISLDIGVRGSVAPQVASDGRDFLVTQFDMYHSYEYRAVRVSSAGLLLDTAEIRLGRVSMSQEWPAPVTYGGGVYLVYDRVDARAWRVSSEGAVLDSVTNLRLAGSTTATTFADSNFLVSSWHGRQEVAGLRISPSGVLLDSIPVVLVALTPGLSEVNSSTNCAMAADTSHNVGLVFISYERPAYMSYRVRASTFSFAPGGVRSPDHIGGLAGLAIVGPTMVSRSVPLRATNPAELFDASGRRVASLRTGLNDISQLTLGVYFVREAQAQAQAQAVRKVVLLR